MKNKTYLLIILFSFIIFGCGDITTTDDDVTIYNSIDTSDTSSSSNSSTDSTISDNDVIDIISSEGILKIIGKVTYDRVWVNSNGIGLDYNHITKEPSKQVIVKAIGVDGQVKASTTTDDNGNYVLNNLPSNSTLKVRVYAQLKKSGVGGWDVKVVDNTNSNSQYVMESSSIFLANNSLRVNLNAGSGWDGSSYSSERTAAPFAILGSIYQAMQKVLSADSNATFPPLVVNWSKNNVSSPNLNVRDGQIITSQYDGQELYILGDANSDTDEYDNHIIIHEWGHYFEAKFSRADSIGGRHGAGDYLDIRVAFGEGWGNAWSAIATDDPIYYDTKGIKQSDGFSMNIENQTPNNPSWYSEASIQRILYDLYDSHNDGADTLSLGFKPIYDVLVGPQKTTPAFTSIFSFITYLKKQNPSATAKIDDILASENIGSIQNIYGSSIESNLYTHSMSDVCTTSKYGQFNKLYNHRYIRFNIPQTKEYIIRDEQNNGSNSDPDFSLHKTSPFEDIGISNKENNGLETATYRLTRGNYLLDISD
ncbi:MAG: hypothetical protein KAU90_05660, partial [Sulfurovaceae bacterium]|nr:hypothetical protein [Sulfurovaceae bacterium]